MGAAPIGKPGCPLLARCTASMDKTRMALIASVDNSEDVAKNTAPQKLQVTSFNQKTIQSPPV